MKVIINPTWACQFYCPYCSIHAQGLEKDTRQLAARQWGWWVHQLPVGSCVEISGGEPLLYAGLVRLLQMIVDSGCRWGLTTNAAHLPAVEALVAAKIPGAISLNVSVQPESPPDIIERALALKEAGYPVHLNRVEHPASPTLPDTHGLSVNHIPYQAWLEGDAVDDKRRMCDAGAAHFAVDPAGRVYRCLVHLQLRRHVLGTVAQPIHTYALMGPELCDTGCSACYTTEPRQWGIKMELAE